jgi:hypothetical protein
MANLFYDARALVKSLTHLADVAASAIEARRVETEGLDAKHESAAPKADAQEGS